MREKGRKQAVSALLALLLCLGLFMGPLPASACAGEGETAEGAEQTEETSQISEEKQEAPGDGILPEGYFLRDGIFDAQAAFAYYQTLSPEEQALFLAGLSDGSLSALQELLTASGTAEEGKDPGDASGQAAGTGTKDNGDGETGKEASGETETAPEVPSEDPGEETEKEKESGEQEQDGGAVPAETEDLLLQVGDVLSFPEAESIRLILPEPAESPETGEEPGAGTAPEPPLRIEGALVTAENVTQEPVLLIVDEKGYRVTVDKAVLGIFLIDGQSNAVGSSGNHDAQAIVPPAGKGYLWQDGSLRDLNGAVKAMEKASPSASVGFWPALAAEWHALTGAKPVILCVGHNGRPIQDWSTYASSAVSTLNSCLDAIDPERFTVAAGGYFWLQGESNSDPDHADSQMIYTTAPEYAAAFEAVHNTYIAAFSARGISAFGGILAVRSWNNYSGKNEVSEFCGPRAAQQYLANRYGNLFIASAVSDRWKIGSDKSFTFKAASGKYTVSASPVSSLFADLHYSQKAYNMMGMDAADGIWSGWLSGNGASDFSLMGYDGKTVLSPDEPIHIQDHCLIIGPANSRETGAAQLTVVPVPRSGACGGVTMTLSKASDGSPAEGLMEPCGYFPDISAIREDLTLQVSMGSGVKTYTIKREFHKLKTGKVEGGGTIRFLNRKGESITTAGVGDTVFLEGKPGAGSLQTLMTVAEAESGKPAAVTYLGNENGCNRYSFRMPASDVRAEAVFIEPGKDNIGYGYRISFEKNASDATGTMKSQSGRVTATATVSPNCFGRKGFRFTGWNTEPDGTGVVVADREKLVNVFFYRDQTLILYAQWAEEAYEAAVSGGVMTLHWKPGESVSIDGITCTADENGVIRLNTKDPKILTVYTYNRDTGDEHGRYPTGMKVYVFTEEKNGTYRVEYMQRLDNILQYAGSSIRITGNRGIRMITGVPESVKRELAGTGIDGYILLETGTAVQWEDRLAGADLTLNTPDARWNFAYKRGSADPVFASVNGVQQYTNVLVGFSMDQCAPDLVMRAYMKLQAPDGSTAVIYGGAVHRSIGYIAWQNRNAFSAGTDAYRYIWDIIHHVYGTKYDAEFKG